MCVRTRELFSVVNLHVFWSNYPRNIWHDIGRVYEKGELVQILWGMAPRPHKNATLGINKQPVKQRLGGKWPLNLCVHIIMYIIHCIHFLLPSIKSSGYSLRAKGHPYQLPRCEYELHKKSFIPRCLYRNCNC